MTKKQLEKAYYRAFKVHANRVRFNIFDLGKMENEVIAAVTAGADLDKSMVSAVEKYRVN